MNYVITRGFPGGSVIKNTPASEGDTRNTGSTPRSGRSPRGGSGTPRQHSCLRNPRDRAVWRATVHGVAKSQTWLSSWAHTHLIYNSCICLMHFLLLHILSCLEDAHSRMLLTTNSETSWWAGYLDSVHMCSEDAPQKWGCQKPTWSQLRSHCCNKAIQTHAIVNIPYNIVSIQESLKIISKSRSGDTVVNDR